MNLYSFEMKKQTALVFNFRFSEFKEVVETLKSNFEYGVSSSQMIIDIKDKIVYTLSVNKSDISKIFKNNSNNNALNELKSKLSGTFKIVNTNYFDEKFEHWENTGTYTFGDEK